MWCGHVDEVFDFGWVMHDSLRCVCLIKEVDASSLDCALGGVEHQAFLLCDFHGADQPSVVLLLSVPIHCDIIADSHNTFTLFGNPVHTFLVQVLAHTQTKWQSCKAVPPERRTEGCEFLRFWCELNTQVPSFGVKLREVSGLRKG